MKIFEAMFVAVLIQTTFLQASFSMIDSYVEKDESSFWKSHYDIPAYSALIVVGIAGYEGTQTRLGKTAWKSIDAAIFSSLATQGLKVLTRRVRPRYTDNPNFWEEKGTSFPSQHVAGMTAIITPFVLEYQEDYPLVHLLWALPVHQMIGRVKLHAHWQSDVLAGFAIGAISGLVAHHNETPFILNITPDSMQVGFKHRF